MKTLQELRSLSLKEMESMLTSLAKQLTMLRFKRKMGEENQTHSFQGLRKQRARVLTIMNEKKGKQIMTEQTQAKQIVGTVKSDKMDKTITVVIIRRVKHKLYNKYMKRSTKLMVHDETNSASEGDLVKIELTRPLSKNKSWQLVEIIEKRNT